MLRILGLGNRGGSGVMVLTLGVAIAEEELTLVFRQRLTSLVPHAVHADEELSHHRHEQILALAGERDRLPCRSHTHPHPA